MKLWFALLVVILLDAVVATPGSASAFAARYDCPPDELDIPSGASGIDGDVPGTAVEAMKKRKQCLGPDF